jgi:hypothetical protein
MLAEDGQGMFQTLAPVQGKANRAMKKAEAYQKRRFQAHVLRLRQEMLLPTTHPSSPETRLVGRFTDLLRVRSDAYQPVLALGDWVASVPARIGSNRAVTMAAQFFVHAAAVHGEASYSNRAVALQTKSVALRELQGIVLATSGQPTSDVLLATKLHYAAEVGLCVCVFVLK